jgi:hypothetical protein
VSKVKKSSGLFSAKTLKRIVMFYCYFYLISAVMTLAAMLFGLVHNAFPIIYILAAGITAVLSTGLYLRKSWVPMSIIVVAIVGLVSNLLSPIHDIFWILSIVFLAFETFFFSTKDTKTYFRS